MYSIPYWPYYVLLSFVQMMMMRIIRKEGRLVCGKRKVRQCSCVIVYVCVLTAMMDIVYGVGGGGREGGREGG